MIVTALVDHNADGQIDAMDYFDEIEPLGVPDDYNGDGIPDNRFYFNLQAPWVPDADSFDDYEEPGIVPRGLTPVPGNGNCPADGIATGPLDLSGVDGRPVFTTWEPSHYCVRE